MKSITQEHDFGCGIASVAFVLKISYKETFRYFDIKKARLQGFYCKDLINVFNRFGLYYEYKYLKPRIRRRIYKKATIVFIRKSKAYPYGHYLVRVDKGWMDSWINIKISTNIRNSRSGFRKRLPGNPIYALFPKI